VKVLAGAIVIAGAAVLFAFDPSTSAFYPRCVFRALTGLDCPGCGATRALHALLHGRVAEAWRYNPMFLALIAVGGVAVPTRVIEKRWFAIATIAALVVWGVIRNL